jgi:tetratricopeptide (TPR) repeat protein
MMPGIGKSRLAMALLVALLLAGGAWGAWGAAPPAPPGASMAPAPPPPAPPSWRELSDTGYQQLTAGDLPAALASFEAALELNPRGAAARTGKGIVLARRGELELAEKVLREALVLNPDPTRTHYELGRIYQQQGDYQRAIDEFKQGIEKYRESHP